jgi:DNA-binding MarR family transcriptional regulator
VSLGRLGNFLGFRLRRLQNQLARDFRARTREWKLRAGQFSALEIIAANPGISQTNLSREVGLDKSVMVALIDDMESRGWVARGRSETDRRHYRLLITPAGQDAVDQLFVDLQITESTGLQAVSAAERAVVLKALDLVYTAYVRPKA